MCAIDDFFDEIIHLEKTGSTNDYARELIINKMVTGNFLVISDEQHLGRGRNEKFWYSPKGGIWMTSALKNLPEDLNITIFTGTVIHKSLVTLFPELKDSLKIKWPNDIYLDEKKICGVLSHHLGAFSYHLIGVGINSNISQMPDEVSDIATSLASLTNREFDNSVIIDSIFEIFFSELPLFIESGLAQAVDYLSKFNFLEDKEIILDTDFQKFSGIVKGFNKQGAILLELRSGNIQPFYAGSVILQ
ncbi:MAG: biotin--[acetyl-CoA-carboxylase] ligase [Candidatus Cloacimonetes bacterium]|nr:biotin--[acetyl-CoA-carboxylase] ligase [Candidatus Cloacimonadota bacterium]